MPSISKAFRILRRRLNEQGLRVTTLWAADHLTRMVTGANLRCVSQITPQIHVGGQYRRRGWPHMTARGITAVVNMRIEWDDNDAGIAPERYLYLPTVERRRPNPGTARTGGSVHCGGNRARRRRVHPLWGRRGACGHHGRGPLRTWRRLAGGGMGSSSTGATLHQADCGADGADRALRRVAPAG